MEGRLTLSDSAQESLLSVQLKHRVGVLALDVEFELTQPWTVLFGPSGSGKTTVLRAIAGFVRPDQARIISRLRGRELVMTDTARKILVPPHERGVRVAGQGATLFPHWTVQENIAFGAQSQADGSSAAAIVEESIARFHLHELAEKLPSQLSGGERQRVAIARAATAAVSVNGGSLLLLDEPFTGQNLRLRDQLIEDLRDWLTQMRTHVLSVTHGVSETFQLDAEVIKIADGRVVQQGPVAAVLADERAQLMDQLNASKRSPA